MHTHTCTLVTSSLKLLHDNQATVRLLRCSCAAPCLRLETAQSLKKPATCHEQQQPLPVHPMPGGAMKEGELADSLIRQPVQATQLPEHTRSQAHTHTHTHRHDGTHGIKSTCGVCSAQCGMARVRGRLLLCKVNLGNDQHRQIGQGGRQQTTVSAHSPMLSSSHYIA